MNHFPSWDSKTISLSVGFNEAKRRRESSKLIRGGERRGKSHKKTKKKNSENDQLDRYGEEKYKNDGSFFYDSLLIYPSSHLTNEPTNESKFFGFSTS